MARPLQVGVLASGAGTNLQSILDACRDGHVPAEVAVVLANKADAGALDRARKAGVPAHFVDTKGIPREAHERQMAALLDAAGVELVCLAGYMRLLTPWFVARYRGRLVNIHPALLPSFPGAHAVRQALEHGVKLSGCTTHLVTEETDAGPIILQAAVPVYEDDTEETLQARIRREEHRVYPETVRLFAEGRIRVEGRTVRIGATRPREDA